MDITLKITRGKDQELYDRIDECEDLTDQEKREIYFEINE